MTEIQTRYGLIKTPNLNDDLIQKSLVLHGEWAYTEQCLLAALIKKDDVFWDGGAFLGTFGLGVVQIAAEAGNMPARLVAIEPGADISPHIQANLKANCPCPYQVAEYAISEKECRLEVKNEGDQSTNLGGRAYQTAKAKLFGANTINGRPLWQLREMLGDYTCLKLDIENMELQALRGDFDFIKQRKPTLWIECNEHIDSLKVHEAMCGLGYQPLYVAFPAFRADNFKGHADLIYPMAYEAALVGVDDVGRKKLEQAANEMCVDVLMREVSDAWALRQALWATPRWSMDEWLTMSRVELVALLGRLHRGQDLGSFLNDMSLD